MPDTLHQRVLAAWTLPSSAQGRIDRVPLMESVGQPMNSLVVHRNFITDARYLSGFGRIRGNPWTSLYQTSLEARLLSLLHTPPQRILIIRLSALGDVVMASPLIRMLRDTYPQAHIVWLVQDEGADLLSANADLDEVMILPRRRWRKLWRQRRWLILVREIYGFTAALRSRHFDTVFDLQGLLKSAIWARLSKARQRLGLRSGEGSGVLMTRIISTPQGDRRIGSEYRYLADQLGLKGVFTLHIALSNNDDQYGHHAKVSFGSYIVLCPFTTRPQKHWFDNSWVQLVQLLRHQNGFKFLMLGGPGDKLAAEKIRDHDGLDIIDMTGHTSLRQAAALIHYAKLLIGVDTGLTHMGIALDTPTIALFGSTCPYQEAGKDNVKVLYKKLDCSPCRRHPTCNGEYTCMRSLKPTDVAAAAQTLLKSS